MSNKKPFAKIEKKGLIALKGRKIMLIPLLSVPSLKNIKKEIQEEFSKKVKIYIENLDQWLNRYESKIGNINRIYIQSLTSSDAQDLKKIEFLKNKDSIYFELINNLIEKGAKLQATEDPILVNESLEWLSQIQSYGALDIDYELFLDSIKDRDNYIVKRIDETLKDNETAILLIGIDHNLDFSQNIEVIRFRPPVIDDIMKLLKN